MDIKARKINNDIRFENVSFYLRKGKKARITVTGKSMLPFLDERYDEVILEPVNTKDIKVGNIALAYINNSKYYLHRIIKIKDNTITLMGDGNLKQTEQCYYNDIKAIVKTKIRNDREVDLTTPAFCKKVDLWLKLQSYRRLLLIFYNLFTDKNYIRKKLYN